MMMVCKSYGTFFFPQFYLHANEYKALWVEIYRMKEPAFAWGCASNSGEVRAQKGV